MTDLAADVRRDLDLVVATVRADLAIGSGGRSDDRVVAHLEALADRVAALDPALASQVSTAADAAGADAPGSFPAERPRRVSLRDPGADGFLRALSSPVHARFAAGESALVADVYARTSTPLGRVVRAARSAAGLLRARLAGWDGSSRARGLFCAALADLCAAVDAWSGAGVAEVARDPRGVASRGPGPGPYREKPASDPEGRTDVEIEVAVAALAEAAGLEDLRRTLLAHGLMMQAIARTRNDARGLLGRLAFWTQPAEDELEARGAWHRALALVTFDAAVVAFARARRGVFVFDLRDALLEAEASIGALRPGLAPGSLGAGVGEASDAGGVVLQQREALHALDRLRRILARAWGDPGDRATLARDVIAHVQTHLPASSPIAGERLRRRLSRAELVALLAETLRATTFVADHHARKHAAGALERRNELFEQALWRYPPAALLYRLDAVVAKVGAVAAVVDGTLGNPSAPLLLRGKRGASFAFSQWATASRATFGWVPSDAELLARHWGRRLV